MYNVHLDLHVPAGRTTSGTGTHYNATPNTACATGLTTIGYGAGADEEGDCGHIFHTGEGILYLRSVKKTTPSLNVKIDGTVFYGNMSKTEKNMSDGVSKKLKVKNTDGTYHVFDDSVE